jgi:hypothetical protein
MASIGLAPSPCEHVAGVMVRWSEDVLLDGFTMLSVLVRGEEVDSGRSPVCRQRAYVKRVTSQRSRPGEESAAG